MDQVVTENKVEKSDEWVPTVCMGCYNCCGIRAHKVDGRVVDVEGDMLSPNSRGHICAKGKARFVDVDHPKRLMHPVRRTNPEKGIGVDPKWKEISWDEALTEIAERLKSIRESDPRKLVIAHFDLPAYGISNAFCRAFGTTNYHWNRADYCGAAPHLANLLLNGAFNGEMDFEKCRYMVLWGTQLGHVAETIPLHAANQMANARKNGARLVVIDPFCSNAASMADEWVPIKPGTDGALALGMLNVMLNELDKFDEPFIRDKTNGPYLIGEDGHYMRDAETNKPLVWDDSLNAARPFDTYGGEPALDGDFEVNGEKCRPAFGLLRNHLKQFDVDEMSRITTVPATTIRRLTAEFVEAAQIGSTIMVEGQQFPLRPAALHFKRGSGAHKGGGHSMLALHMINLMVGNLDVPGGQRGVNPIGPTWAPETSEDGLLIPAQKIAKYNKPYPPAEAKRPQTLDLHELFPGALFTRALYPMVIDDPEAFGFDYKPEMLIQHRTNLMMNSHNADAMAATLKKFSFQLSFGTLIDETAEFADIVLPDAHDLERWDLFPANDPYAFITPGPGDWFWLMRQCVIDPPEGVRPWTDVFMELAERIGMLEEFYEHGNEVWNIDPEFHVDPKGHHSVADIAERQAKTVIGPDYSHDQLDETGCIITRAKTLEEAYPRVFMEARVPIYFEHLIDTAKDVKKVTDELGLDWDFAPYNPLLQYFACDAHKEDGDFDLITVNFKVPFQTFSVTAENVWVDEIASANPYLHKVMVNAATARKKGLQDGDHVIIESHWTKDEGIVKVTELVHPECLGIPGTLGHWARDMVISQGKGTAFNNFLPPPTMNRVDTWSGQVDSCVRVKLTKVEPKGRK
jgi:anaerobic selenocysteine-containing dehydrogenase